MNLLLDQHVPLRAAALLRDVGRDAVHVREIGMSRSADAEILDVAVAQRRVVVTYDADFHQLLARRGTTAPSVIRLRIEGMGPERFVATLLPLLVRFADELLARVVVTATTTKARVHELPLGIALD